MTGITVAGGASEDEVAAVVAALSLLAAQRPAASGLAGWQAGRRRALAATGASQASTWSDPGARRAR